MNIIPRAVDCHIQIFEPGDSRGSDDRPIGVLHTLDAREGAAVFAAIALSRGGEHDGIFRSLIQAKLYESAGERSAIKSTIISPSGDRHRGYLRSWQIESGTEAQGLGMLESDQDKGDEALNDLLALGAKALVLATSRFWTLPPDSHVRYTPDELERVVGEPGGMYCLDSE